MLYSASESTIRHGTIRLNIQGVPKKSRSTFEHYSVSNFWIRNILKTTLSRIYMRIRIANAYICSKRSRENANKHAYNRLNSNINVNCVV